MSKTSSIDASETARDEARRLLAISQGRTTSVRLAALSALIESDRPLSHAEAHRLRPDLDRVSLYRALDWLVDNNLAHRLTDAQGVKRYGRGDAAASHGHPHFQCVGCGQTMCLDQIVLPSLVLPDGFNVQSVDVMVRGQCRACAKGSRKK